MLVSNGRFAGGTVDGTRDYMDCSFSIPHGVRVSDAPKVTVRKSGIFNELAAKPTGPLKSWG
jgi:hypothetical protein